MRKVAWLIPSVALLGPLSPAFGADLWVSPSGTHATIAAAVSAATSGDRILVEAGTYFENITLIDGIALRGGYAPGDSSEANRDPDVHTTIINGSGTGAVVSAGMSVGAATVVDGFGLTGAGGSPGACIVIAGGSPVFSNNEIFQNSGGIAGGAYIYGGSGARFENNLFRQNAAAGSGGGVRIENSSAEIVSNTFNDNDAPHAGGAIYVFRSAPTISNNVVRDCDAGDSGGGGAYFQESSSGAMLSGNDFENCRASRGGGVMIRDESFVTLEDNDFIGCIAERVSAGDSTGTGGGVAVFNYSEVTLRNNRFENCSSALHGGGLYARLSEIQVLGTDATDVSSMASFSNCTADTGGAVYAFQCEGAVFSNQRVSDCTANGSGGGLFLDTSEFALTENVIERCTAPDGGGVTFYSFRSVPDPPQNTFLNNTVFECGTLSGAGNPGGGILHQAIGFQTDIALIAGCMITNTTVGSCIRCRGLGGLPASRPTIHCSSFQNEPGNNADVIGNPQCVGAFTAGINNLASDAAGGDFYSGPEYCNTSSFNLRECEDNPDLGSLCAFAVPDRVNRGVTDAICACLLISLEPSTWGAIKARYR